MLVGGRSVQAISQSPAFGPGAQYRLLQHEFSRVRWLAPETTLIEAGISMRVRPNIQGALLTPWTTDMDNCVITFCRQRENGVMEFQINAADGPIRLVSNGHCGDNHG